MKFILGAIIVLMSFLIIYQVLMWTAQLYV